MPCREFHALDALDSLDFSKIDAIVHLAGKAHDLKNVSDPRVLPFGLFLRKTKINELPQIFNIFLGDMSIVGPRPLVDKTFAPYSDEVKAKIYNVKPGLISSFVPLLQAMGSIVNLEVLDYRT